MSMSGDAYRDARRHGPDRPGLAAAGALTGAFGASACCILPLLLFSLGAGGVWVGRLGALSPYQPWFIGVAVLSLTYGFWRTYRARRDACDAGDACARPLPNRAVKLGLWSATALVATSLAFPYLVPILP